MMQHFDLIIIGGGASGLTAAVTAVSMGVKHVLILERLPRTGKKILATGNGRCNLSHADLSALDYQGSYDVTGILQEFGSVIDFFENLGLYCRTDEQGRLYPYSMTANSVLDALRLHCTDATELCNECVISLNPVEDLWQIGTESGKAFTATHVIFAAGGTVQPKFGTDGSAWKLLENLNIPVIPGRPILCPILSDKKRLQSLKGIRVKGSVTLYHKNQACKTETGEIQFTDQTVSGICVFNLISEIHRNLISEYNLSINLFPELSREELLARLYTCQAVRSETDCENMLSGLMQKALARSVLKSCQIKADLSCSLLSYLSLEQIADTCQDFRFPVLGIFSAQAQASAGGVRGDVLDSHLQLKSYPRLYITGEATDVYAPCGGYQLHWAWASGYVAGKYCAERILS